MIGASKPASLVSSHCAYRAVIISRLARSEVLFEELLSHIPWTCLMIHVDVSQQLAERRRGVVVVVVLS